MKATVIEQFKGVRDGEVHPVTFKSGDTVVGDLARVAVEEGWAKPKGSAPAQAGTITDVTTDGVVTETPTSDPDKTQPQETKPRQGQSKKGKKR